MALTISSPAGQQKIKRGSTHTKPRQPPFPISEDGRYFTDNMLYVFNVSHSTFDAGRRIGRYPAPSGYDGTRPYWTTASIREFNSNPPAGNARRRKRPQGKGSTNLEELTKSLVEKAQAASATPSDE
jgi:hypothetical protein